MKKKSSSEKDEMLPEYDLAKLPVIARGPGHSRQTKLVWLTRVNLAPDVAQVFPDDEAVNQALRVLMRVTEAQRRKAS